MMSYYDQVLHLHLSNTVNCGSVDKYARQRHSSQQLRSAGIRNGSGACVRPPLVDMFAPSRTCMRRDTISICKIYVFLFLSIAIESRVSALRGSRSRLSAQARTDYRPRCNCRRDGKAMENDRRNASAVISCIPFPSCVNLVLDERKMKLKCVASYQ